MPDEDFLQISQQLAYAYQGMAIKCSYSGNYCMFEQSCSYFMYEPPNFHFTIYDADGNKFDANLGITELLIPGTSFGLSDQYCYFGLFRSMMPNI